MSQAFIAIPDNLRSHDGHRRIRDFYESYGIQLDKSSANLYDITIASQDKSKAEWRYEESERIAVIRDKQTGATIGTARYLNNNPKNPTELNLDYYILNIPENTFP